MTKYKYPNLKKIFEIPELEPTAEMLDFSGMSESEKIVKMKQNIDYSKSLRVEFIQYVQRKSKVYRLKILRKLKEDGAGQKLGAIEFERCKRDPLYFFNVYLRTYNPRLEKPHLPFLTYPYQDEFIQKIIDAINGEYDVRVEKTRDMGFSRMMLGIFVRGFIFHGRTTLIGSYKEDYVHTRGDMDSAFERIFYMINRLPGFMKPGDLLQKFMSVSSSENGERQIGGDAGKFFGTGGRRKAVLLDEFGGREHDKNALRKTKDVTECRIFGGTPEGTGNVYGKVMTNHKDYAHLSIVKIRLHWKEHPLKTQYRYSVQIQIRTKFDLAREIDISYDDSVVGQVYPNFRTMVHIGDYNYTDKYKLYRSYDFGLDGNVCLWRQKDFRTGSLFLVNAVVKTNRDIRKFIGLVLGEPTPGFTYDPEDHLFMEEVKYYKKTSGDFGDPYNSDNRTVIDADKTIAKEFSKRGIYLTTKRRNTLYGRIRKTKLAFTRMYIRSTLHEFMQSMIQSKRPKKSENSQATTEVYKPVHNEDSHYRTACEYFIDNEPESVTTEGKIVDYKELY